MKKKIIVLSILAVSTIGTIASAASFAGAVLPEGVASGTLYESGTKGAIATTTLETTKSGAKAYVYLEAKSGTTKLKSTNKQTKKDITLYRRGRYKSFDNLIKLYELLLMVNTKLRRDLFSD